VTGGGSAAIGTGRSGSDVHTVGDDSLGCPSGRKRAKVALFQSQAIAGAMRVVARAMRAVAASMAASASSIAKSVDAQTERNGIMVFAEKVDTDDVEAKEFFTSKRKFHLQNARAEVETLSLVASAANFPSTGGSSAAGNENNDVNNNNNMSSNNDNTPRTTTTTTWTVSALSKSASFYIILQQLRTYSIYVRRDSSSATRGRRCL
jgi:hypothetical protein